jgi:hypothetical protein
VSQRLHPYEATPQEYTNHTSSNQPTNQILPTIIEGPEHLAFRQFPEAHLHQSTHASINEVEPSQTGEGAPRQSPLRAPSPTHILSEDAELDQVQIDDWDEEAEEEAAVAEDEELARVQQEIERLWQEQESILRRQSINKERARLVEM